MFEQFCPECSAVKQAFLGGIFGSLLALGIAFAVVLILGLYVYTSYTWMTIARKLKYKKSYLAWVPIANIAMILQLGGFHWAWVFLVLIPILGWFALFVLMIIATWRIYEKRKYPGWFSLSMILPKGIGMILSLIVIGFVAFKDRKKPMKF